MNTPNFRLPADFFLIDKVVEPLTQKIQKYIGLDCFFWAKMCLWIAQICGAGTIVYILFMYVVWVGHLRLELLFVFSILLFMEFQLLLYHCIILWSRVFGLAVFKKIAYKALENGARNPLLLVPRSLMVTGIGFIMLTFLYIPSASPWEILFECVWKTPFVFGYFAQCFYSCTPLPPQKSVLRAKLESMQELFAEGFGEAPVPEPA